jgi:hypothetical protein
MSAAAMNVNQSTMSPADAGNSSESTMSADTLCRMQELANEGDVV